MRTTASVRVLALLGALVAALAGTTATAADEDVDLLRFGAEMARAGNWREARYRWELAARSDPEDARLLNNLAVAHEALGERDTARDFYTRALRSAPDSEPIADNVARFGRFDALARPDASDGPSPPSAGAPRGGGGGKTRGRKTAKVIVKLPLPPRLDVSQAKSLLVAAFLTGSDDLMDTNREIVRFLRGEFRKHSPLETLDVVPVPAVPEQPIDDLAANVEFWRHLGREHGADLIVSGLIQYGRRETSGFQDVDLVSPVTGQKVRQTRYVEQEQFTYDLDVLFLDGATGGLRFRDRIRRSARYNGLGNDPITAFFDLSDGIAGDVLAVISTRTREEPRVIFVK